MTNKHRLNFDSMDNRFPLIGILEIQQKRHLNLSINLIKSTFLQSIHISGEIANGKANKKDKPNANILNSGFKKICT